MFHSFLLLVFASNAQTVQWSQLTIEQRVIVRVPMVRQRQPPPAKTKWNEKKGPRCVALGSIRSASIIVADGIDLILNDNHRYRARLERGCRSTGFYSGFYVEPDEDGSLCAGRDDLQARSGLSCEIDSFKRLVADK